MMTKSRTFLVLLLFNFVFVNGQITIDNLPDSTTVKEYETTNICVHELEVTDSADNSTGFTCALNPTNSKFTITEDPVTNKYCINYVDGPGPYSTSESVTVECTNDLSDSDSKILSVNPKLNEAPQIPKTVSATVDTTLPPGDLIYTLTATDSDGDSLTYTLTSPSPYFIIGTNDGTVKASKDLRSVTSSPITLDITVTDSYNTPKAFQLIITITNLNTEPTITNVPSSPIKVKEDKAAGFIVYKCVLDDPTPGTNSPPTTSATFNPSTTDLEFDANACEIKVSGKLEDEDQKTYDVQITVNDGFLSKQYDLSIEVEHVPSTVTINNLPDTTSVKEKQNIDICLKTLNVTNTGSGGVICDLTAVHPKFEVTKRDGAPDYCVYFIHNQDNKFEQKSYLLKVECANDEGVSDTKDVKIDVQLNNAPSVAKSVGEVVDVSTSKLGNPLYTINATDPDGNPLTFTVLRQSPPDAGFTVGADDGTIWASQDLRFSNNPSVTIEVEISDGLLKTSTNVTLTMTNLNIAPMITNVATINAAENTEKGVEIYKCNVQDDTVYKDLTYTAIFNPPNNALVFDATTCAIRISDNEKLDFEKQKSYDVKITVNDGFKESEYSLQIDVIDENDPPEFTVLSYPFEVEEGPASAIKFTPEYKYRDPEGNAVSYEIVNTGPAIFQIINPLNGTITNVAEIDYENLPTNPIPVTVRVKDDTSGDSEAIVYVTIKDANDNKPIFEKSLYDFNISLSTPGSTKLTTVKATDNDSTTNAEITYRLKGSSPFFEVLPSGDVILKSQITVPYGSILKAEIEAVDSGSPQLIGTTTITGVWNKAPKIEGLPEYPTIAEDQTDAKDIFVFATTDPENDAVNCKVKNITSQAPAEETDGAFIVVKNSGTEEFTIRYSGSYKFSQKDAPTFDIFVICEDGNGGTDVNFLNVRVAPNEPPIAACSPEDSVTVNALNNAVNTVVYNRSITDIENDPLIITFRSESASGTPSDPSSDFYGYDAATRTIQVRKDLRRETESKYTWFLEIDDQKHDDKVYCKIFVTVTNLNKAPVFSKEDQTVSLPEDTPQDSVVHTFAVTDADNTTIICDVDPISEANVFVIDENLKTIKLAPGKEFDFEGAHQMYKFFCTTTDSYLSATSTLTMMITDTNDRPEFKKTLYTATIDEGMPGTVTINANFSFTDEEMSAGQTYAYSLESSGSDDSVFFDIDPNTGVIKNVKELDVDAADAKETIRLTVKVTDSEGAAATTFLDINIRDINDKTPVIDPNVYESFTLAENIAVGTVLKTIRATDEDKDEINKNIVYSLDEPNEFFDVTPDGKLTLMKPLVGQYSNTYPIKVKATDTGVNPGPKSITAPVIFTWNDKPTITNLDTVVTIKEDQTDAMDVEGSDIVVTDPDDDPVECKLFSITPNTDAFKVEDEGKIVRYTAKRPLVYREVSSYLAQIECRDTVGGGRDQKTLKIDIEKNHAPKPNCAPSVSTTIDVASADFHKQGASVFAISTTDEETDPITYTLENGAPPGALQAFTVGKFDGRVITTRDLRYIVREPVRQLIIAVADDHQNTVTCTIIVTLDNLNEPPKFKNLPTTVDVDESLEPEGADREIYKVEIEDLVTCSEPIGISWDIDPSTDKDIFTITQDKKVLTISVAKGQELDHEKDAINNQYKFTIRAQDGCLLESSQVLTVNVKDINEPPEFLKGDKYYANISQVETDIIDLGCQGFDPDTADKLTLELTGTGSDQFKVIDHAKCHIQLIGEYLLDKPEALPAILKDLKMKLTDKAGESVEADLQIDIWDYNNHAPKFDVPAYEGAPIYPGDLVGKDLGKVIATDDDITEETNGAVEYYLKGCNNGGAQFVSVLGDGSVKLKSSPAKVGIQSGTIFNCKVEARDKGIKPGVLTGTTLFDVLYTDPPPTLPPATEAPDDNNDNNNDNNNNNNNNGNDNSSNNNGNSNSGGTTTTTDAEDFLSSPAAIALLSVLGALLLGLLLFAILRCCCGFCGGGGTGCMNGGSSGNYGGRATSPSQIHVNEGKYNSVRPTPVVHP